MACEDADDAIDQLNALLAGPKVVTTDGMTVEQQSLKDLLQAIKFLRGQCATESVRRGLRFTKLVPPPID